MVNKNRNMYPKLMYLCLNIDFVLRRNKTLVHSRSVYIKSSSYKSLKQFSLKSNCRYVFCKPNVLVLSE